MNFNSTRGQKSTPISAAMAIKNGLANDGGLYMPEAIPQLTKQDFSALLSKDYAERAAFILGKFLTDYTEEELLTDCKAAYSAKNFVGGAAPVVEISEGLYALELWHGPTCAFKDMALQIMPRLLSRALQKTGEKRSALILVATSGDTGKAALEGYRDIPQIKIQVYYPENGVSTVQKLQMQTQLGSNVNVVAIQGNFDDAQSGVKKIFSDAAMADALDKKNVFLSSANSINWGRLAPQIAYYVSAYLDLVQEGKISLGEKIDFCVPTGNFGNIFAGYIAKLMGLPVEKFVCASNKNNVLTDFLANGTYDRNRPFFTTMSPSMDILISSNLERLLYLMAGSEKTAAWMRALATEGCYTVDAATLEKIKDSFCGYCTEEKQTAEVIRDTFAKDGYLCDTHTGVALGAAKRFIAETASSRKMVVVSTASPFKFAADVLYSLSETKAESDVAALDALSEATKAQIPAPLANIAAREVRFKKTILPSEMADCVLSFSEE